MNVAIPKTYTGTVRALERVGQRTITLQLDPDNPIPYIPGQYASFIIGSGRRPFSFTSLPHEATVDFLVGYSEDGLTQTLIDRLQIGNTIELLAPYGRFTVKESIRPLLFIAAGTGIAPVRAMIKSLLHFKDPRHITLLFGNYTPETLYFHKEFTALASEHNRFTYIPSISTHHPDWPGLVGLVTQITPKKIPRLPEFDAYICGNPQMVKDTAAMLTAQGLDKAHIAQEQFT